MTIGLKMKKDEKIEKLKEKLSEIKSQKEHECKLEDEKDRKICELTDTLQRLQAEFENYKKYVEKQNGEFRKYAKSDIIEKLLPILDSFELALKNSSNNENFVKGVELIYSQLYSLLEKEGLKKIAAEGKFDPHYHEVLIKDKSDKTEDAILEELQKGYMLNDKIYSRQ